MVSDTSDRLSRLKSCPKNLLPNDGVAAEEGVAALKIRRRIINTASRVIKLKQIIQISHWLMVVVYPCIKETQLQTM